MGAHVFFSCQNQMIRYCVSKVVYCAFVTWDSSIFFPHYSVYFWHSFLAYLHTYSNYGGEFLTVYAKLKITKKKLLLAFECSVHARTHAHTHIHNLKSRSIFLSFIEYYKSFALPYVCVHTHLKLLFIRT